MREQSVYECPGRMPRAGVHRNSRGLGDSNQVRILVEDVQRPVLGDELGWFRRGHDNTHRHAIAEFARRFARGTVDGDVTFSDQTLQAGAAEALTEVLLQETVETLTVNGHDEAMGFQRYQMRDSMWPFDRRMMSTMARS